MHQDLSPFQASISKALQREDAPASFAAIRQNAKERLAEVGLPSKKLEPYRYLKLSQLSQMSFVMAEKASLSGEALKPLILPECAHSHLVFVNGFFQRELSNWSALPQEIVIQSLEEASETFGTILQNRFLFALKGEKDPIALLHWQLFQSGAFIYVPPGCQTRAPLQILSIRADSQAQLHGALEVDLPKVEVYLGKESALSLVSTTHALKKEAGVSWPLLNFTLDAKAHLSLLQDGYYREDSWTFSAVRGELKAEAIFEALLFTEGSKLARHDYRLCIGEKARGDLTGLNLLRHKNESHTVVEMQHYGEDSRSNQYFKGALQDLAFSTFEGKIFIDRLAQKTEAYQLDTKVLLSDGARTYSKPNLEIFADDVKASHGATVGQLDKEALFYLRTRGFSEVEAKRLLIQAFGLEIVQKIDIASFQRLMDQRLHAFLGQTAD
ncbi:MAG: sufD [Chlamydiales bacterium]|jgi:Fe-S cluster assembly protein SufD|nr:sufD [Chlamydiales bacterium]